MNDRTMLDLLRQGDAQALAVLSRRYRTGIVSHARRILKNAEDAEDVAEETLLKALSANGLCDPGAVERWLHVVCHRLALDRLRASGRLERPARRAETALSVKPDSPVEKDDDLRRVERALRRLKTRYRRAVVLRYLEGLDFKEIAERMETTERTARTWVGRGLTTLRERLGGET